MHSWQLNYIDEPITKSRPLTNIHGMFIVLVEAADRYELQHSALHRLAERLLAHVVLFRSALLIAVAYDFDAKSS
jgi:hypothetical protein